MVGFHSTHVLARAASIITGVAGSVPTIPGVHLFVWLCVSGAYRVVANAHAARGQTYGKLPQPPSLPIARKTDVVVMPPKRDSCITIIGAFIKRIPTKALISSFIASIRISGHGRRAHDDKSGGVCGRPVILW